MAKQITKKIKINIEAGKATPAPPIGTILGPTGVNMGEFCSAFNEQTKEKAGELIPAVISIYSDRTFSFELHKPPVSFLLKKAAGVDKGSGKNAIKSVGKISTKQLKEIAEFKIEEMNAHTVDQAMKIIEGTARSMGISVKE